MGIALFSAVALNKHGADATTAALSRFLDRHDEGAIASRFAAKLLASDTEADYRPGQAHVHFPQRPHPDDLSALVSVAGPAGLTKFMQENKVNEVSALPSDLTRNLVLFGSPNSEALTRLIFQYEADADNSDRLSRNSQATLPLAYEWILNEQEIDADSRIDNVHKRTVRRIGGKEISRPNWSIRQLEGNKLLVPDVQNGRLSSDFLVVTRLRNFLDKRAFDSGKFIVSWAGAHGVGTKAAELLLRDQHSLATLGRKLEAFDEFQILVKVRKLTEGSYGFQPLQIELLDFEALPVISSDYDALREYLQDPPQTG